MNVPYPHNPLLPDEYFVPDAEAHVWSDGRLYLYGSFDRMGEQSYCSKEYHVFSTDNMKDWVDHGVSFTLADTEWAQDAQALYAPDCAYKNGLYYLYYCCPGGKCGVASSPDPAGPFRDIGMIQHVQGIDPAVFIDDDGQAYLYWGQFDQVRVAKLKDNMTEIDPSTISQPLSVAEHEFHEGSSMRKYNGKYYYVFTDTHRHGHRATSLGYAVSDNPMTGFTYQGIIIDNFGCDPSTWNNHGSIECFHGQWYVFYHRSTHNTVFSRHVCAEPIFFDKDGRIQEVPMTMSGAGEPLPASAGIPSVFASALTGSVYIGENPDRQPGSPDGLLALLHMGDGSTASFRSLLFDGENHAAVTVKSPCDCRMECYLDDRYVTTVSVKACDRLTAFEADFEPNTCVPSSGAHTVTWKCFGKDADTVFSSMTFTSSRS